MEIRELINELEIVKDMYKGMAEQGNLEAELMLPLICDKLMELYLEEIGYMKEDLEEIIHVKINQTKNTKSI